MSTEELQKGFPRDDAETFVKKILDEVRSIRDPATLNACRALFRSKVPFHLRSYVTAALILKSLGVGTEPRETPKEALPRGRGRGDPNGKKDRPLADSVKPGLFARKDPSASAREGTEEARLRKGLFSGEGTTLFFSMGRRQRFTAQNILRVLSGISGIEETDIGRIRTFDNYSFVNVHPAAADLIIQDVDGIQYKGRKLVVNRARARKEDSKSGKDENPQEGRDPGMDDVSAGEGVEKGNPIE